MKILSFDIESCTGSVSDGSLCSFGYYISDEKFNGISQKDLIVNPLARFRSYVIGKDKKIDLAYSEEEFRAAPRFISYYDEIKSLFDSCDIAVGFSVENDVRFLRDACEKFKLPQISYKFIDVKQLLELFNDEYSTKGLSAIAEGLKIDFRAHRSDEDARVTLRVLEYLCKKHKMSLQNLLNYAGIVYGENKNNDFEHMYSLTQIRQQKGFVRTNRQFSAIMNEFKNLNKKFYVKDGPLKRRHIAFSKEVKGEDIDKSYLLVKKAIALGAKYAPSPWNINCFVYKTIEDEEYKFAKNIINSGRYVELIQVKRFEKRVNDLCELKGVKVDETPVDWIKVLKDNDREKNAKRLQAKKKRENELNK